MYLTEKVKSSSRDQPTMKRVEHKHKKTPGGNTLINVHAQAQELAAIVVAHKLDNCAKMCSANGPIAHKIGFSKVHGCKTCDDEVKQRI